MAAAIRHRGPDGYGFYADQRVGLAHVRLSIVDVAGGAQPLTNETGNVVVTFNGEVYNHLELRRQLEARGHVFKTRCDTEVLVHGYEEWGPQLLSRLNGQFAFAIYDAAAQTIFLARDRFGVRPLFYAVRDEALYFASEVKALFASGEVDATPDPVALDEVFTFWAPRAPRSGFAGVAALEPGTYAMWRDGSLRVHRYYELGFCDHDLEPADAIERLDALMRSGVELRMRADVPVGAYLSGGLDSSITATLAAAASPHQLRSFSITFDDPRFDESQFQRDVAAVVGSSHSVASMGATTIADSFPDVIWHTEIPIVRTAPAPMFHLARLTKACGIKVVLTGEGADELFLGYDLFKEVSVRRFCLRRPESSVRRKLFGRLYPYLDAPGATGGEFWQRYFLDAGDCADPVFSHLPRFALTSWIKGFYSPDFAASLDQTDVISELRDSLPERYHSWSPLNKAAYLEMTLLLASYLLSSQGDRMAMAHGVEGRFPFLDHRLFEFSAALPTSSRLRGLKEKEILRRWAKHILQGETVARRKQPYRAPDAASFFGRGTPSYVLDLLSEDSIRRSGLWSHKAVTGLVRRCASGRAATFRENQALVGILSTQLWMHRFVESAASNATLDPKHADVLLQDAAPSLP